jgi:hypothetical protein
MNTDWTDLHWASSPNEEAIDAYGNQTQGHIYFFDCTATDEKEIRNTVNQTIDKMVGLLRSNVWDSSRYCLFEWDKKTKTLDIVVTDDDKKVNSPDIVRCHISAFDDSPDQDTGAEIENLQYWIQNYLTTCTDFFNFSLIAVFHSESRNKTTLL